MGKRSNFERREADFYPTPRAAVLPLIPYLRASGIRTFAEPCAGDGALVRHLESFGLRCVYSGDIRSGQDALALDHYGAADAIITNPPWSRDVLHGLITHFQNIAPTWLLLDADWKETRQAAPFLPHCSDIVAIGRVKWIESKHTGKDNTCWYLSIRIIRPALSFIGATRARRSLQGAPESASNAASVTSGGSVPVRGSARRHAGSAPIARGLA